MVKIGFFISPLFGQFWHKNPNLSTSKYIVFGRNLYFWLENSIFLDTFKDDISSSFGAKIQIYKNPILGQELDFRIVCEARGFNTIFSIFYAFESLVH